MNSASRWNTQLSDFYRIKDKTDFLNRFDVRIPLKRKILAANDCGAALLRELHPFRIKQLSYFQFEIKIKKIYTIPYLHVFLCGKARLMKRKKTVVGMTSVGVNAC